VDQHESREYSMKRRGRMRRRRRRRRRRRKMKALDSLVQKRGLGGEESLGREGEHETGRRDRTRRIN